MPMPHLAKSLPLLTVPERWPTCAAPLPQVKTTLRQANEGLEVTWSVSECGQTFRAHVQHDQGPVWMDSCVEIFVALPHTPNLYLNIECNAKGSCLAAIGRDRHNRQPLTATEMARLQRKTNPIFEHVDSQSNGTMVNWQLQIIIPWDLLCGTPRIPTYALRGNVQKCGDATQAPHWMSAFAIATPRPDFHRSEFFRSLW